MIALIVVSWVVVLPIVVVGGLYVAAKALAARDRRHDLKTLTHERSSIESRDGSRDGEVRVKSPVRAVY